MQNDRDAYVALGYPIYAQIGIGSLHIFMQPGHAPFPSRSRLCIISCWTPSPRVWSLHACCRGPQGLHSHQPLGSISREKFHTIGNPDERSSAARSAARDSVGYYRHVSTCRLSLDGPGSLFLYTWITVLAYCGPPPHELRSGSAALQTFAPANLH